MNIPRAPRYDSHADVIRNLSIKTPWSLAFHRPARVRRSSSVIHKGRLEIRQGYNLGIEQSSTYEYDITTKHLDCIHHLADTL